MRMKKIVLQILFILLCFPIYLVKAQSPEYLSDLLLKSLDGYPYVAYVKIVKYEEKDPWGNYKIWRVNAEVLKNFKGMLPHEICIIAQAEPPYPEVPFIPETVIVSFPQQESECVGLNIVNIFPAETIYFDQIYEYLRAINKK